jgi:CBS domain-containing protein
MAQARPSLVDNLMRRDVVTVPPSASMIELVGLLRRHRVSGVPVVDSHGAVVGTVSVSDLTWLTDTLEVDGADPSFAAKELSRRTVADVMTPDVFGLEPEATLGELARFFARTGLRRAMVLREGRLLGIVSVIDLLGLVVDRLEVDPSS